MKQSTFLGYMALCAGAVLPFAWAGPGESVRDLDTSMARERRDGARIVSVARGGKIHTVRIDTHAVQAPDAVYHGADGQSFYLTQLDQDLEEENVDGVLRPDKKDSAEDASKVLTHALFQKGHKKRVTRIMQHKLKPPFSEKKLADAFFAEIFADPVAREMDLLQGDVPKSAILRRTEVQKRPTLVYDLPPLSPALQREVLDGAPFGGAASRPRTSRGQDLEWETNAAKKRAQIARLVPDEVDKHLTHLQNQLNEIRSKMNQ